MTIIEVVELLKAVIFGFMQGVTEWLPVSSTGTYDFAERVSAAISVGGVFWNCFRGDTVWLHSGGSASVLEAHGSCAVRGGFRLKPDILLLWGKITVACIPAGVAALLWNDEINDLFYHPHVVVIMLIVVGVLFLVVETRKREPSVHTVAELTWRAAWWIGCFQMIAAIFPGTSRSGATIIGALMIGVSRTVAAEFTFIMAFPVMLGASLLS